MNYVPLWIKTDYTLLSSLIKIDDLINKLSIQSLLFDYQLLLSYLQILFHFYVICKKNVI